MMLRKGVLVALCILLMAAPASSEPVGWSDDFYLPGLNHQVLAFGTYQEALVVSGSFSHAGPLRADGVVRWRNGEWIPFGSVFANEFCEFGGQLYAGNRGGVFVDGRYHPLFRWNGTAWDPASEGSPNDAIKVHALAEFQGALVIAGEFERFGSPVAKNIIRFNGTSWSSLSSGIRATNPPFDDYSRVLALVVYNQELYAGGRFDEAGGAFATNLARWDGTDWRPAGQIPGADVVSQLIVYEGMLWIRAGTKFYTWDGATLSNVPGAGGLIVVHEGALLSLSGGNLVEWTGSAWQTRGDASSNGTITRLHSFGGLLVAGGNFTNIGGIWARNIAGWNGSSWQALDSGGHGILTGTGRGVYALTSYNDDLIAGGTFLETDGFVASGIARFDGTTWHQVGSGLSDWVGALATCNGELVAGGGFAFAGATPVGSIARWDGINWRPLGSGLFKPSGAYVRALHVHDGKLYAGGSFTTAGGVSAMNVACWDGANWSPLSTGSNGEVRAFTEFEGDLIAGGSFSQAGFALGPIVRWTGTEWLRVGDGPDIGIYGAIRALVVSGGQLYAGGYASSGQGEALRIFRLSGDHWQQLPSPPSISVSGGGNVSALADMGGSLVAGGLFRERVLRWNGSLWESLGTGLYDGSPLAFHTGSDGLYVGGFFSQAGDKPSYNIARWSESEVPVTLLSFTADWKDGIARIRWQIAGDRHDVSGFTVWREDEGDVKVPVSRFIPAEDEIYEVLDADALYPGSRYWLNEVSRAGELIWHGPIELGPRRPVFQLYQNEPNPFRTGTRIAFELPEETHGDLVIIDVAGRRIATLKNGTLPRGRTEILWNGYDEEGRQVPAGVYFYRLRTPADEVSRKLVVKYQ